MKPISISVIDAAAALGVGRTTIFQMIKNGELEVIKLGRRTLVKVSSLKRLVEGEV